MYRYLHRLLPFCVREYRGYHRGQSRPTLALLCPFLIAVKPFHGLTFDFLPFNIHKGRRLTFHRSLGQGGDDVALRHEGEEDDGKDLNNGVTLVALGCLSPAFKLELKLHFSLVPLSYPVFRPPRYAARTSSLFHRASGVPSATKRPVSST